MFVFFGELQIYTAVGHNHQRLFPILFVLKKKKGKAYINQERI